MPEPEGRGAFPTLREAVGLILLALSLYAAFSVIEGARWITDLPPLILPIAVALALGSHLARNSPRKSVIRTVLVAIVVGTLLILPLGLLRLPGGAQTVLGLFIMAAAWLASLLTLWLARRDIAPALLIIPGLLVVLISLSFLDSQRLIRLPIFLMASAPAITHFHLQRWAGGKRRPVTTLAPLAAGLVFMGVAVAFSWPSPAPQNPLRPAVANRLEEPLYRLVETAADFLEKIPSRMEGPQFNLHPILPFTGPIAQSEDLVMRVTAAEPRRWRLRVYETYTPKGWTRSPEAPRSDTAAQPPAASDDLKGREQATIKVRLFSTNTHAATAGVPVSSGVPTLLETSPQPVFRLNLAGPQETHLPPDVRSLYDVLTQEPAPSSEPVILDDSLAERGLSVAESPSNQAAAQEGMLALERAGAGARPRTALIFPRRQGPPRSYTTTGSVSTASPNELREAGPGARPTPGQDYPHDVTDRFLQLPTDFPQAVSDLALELSQGHDNAYDVAMSIQDHLSALPYNAGIDPPPSDVDPVEWFLTTQRSGFCNYFASAMVTMLRSLDIPARLVVGFAPGEWDRERGAWTVRAKHYHAWPEVYFPQYGWVEFEPTPVGVQPSLGNVGVRPNAPPPIDPELLDECFSVEVDCEPGQDPAGGVDDPSFDEIDLEALNPASPANPGSGGMSPLLIWMASILGLMATAAVGTNLYLRYATARMGAPAMVFSSMSLLARLGGVARHPHYTPAEYGSRVAGRLPRHAGVVKEVVNVYHVSRYDRDKTPSPAQMASLRQSWKVLRWGLLSLIFQRIDPRRLFRHRR